MNNRTTVRYLPLVMVVALSLVSARDAVAQDIEQPNIVFIVADYMGYSDIEPYGATDIRTPALAALAEDGARFSSYYAASPVCGPSRAAMLSGFYPARVGMEANIAPLKGGFASTDDTLVRELKAAGYQTAMVGKWHLGQSPGYSPLSHGFDSFFGFHSWTLGYHDHLTSSGEAGLYRGEDQVSEDGYLTELFTKEAARFIDHSAGQPFFLYLAYNAALPPYQGPDLPESEWSTGWDASEATREDYVAMVESMDQGIGTILNRLDQLKLSENTLVIFTYDHGGRHLVRSDPLFHGFGTLWEGGIRVPLLMKWPGHVTAGQLLDRPSIAMDLTATMLAAAGRSPDLLQLDGSSLLPLLKGGDEVAAAPLFWRFQTSTTQMSAVRQDNWKYLVDGSTHMLFDLDSDIGERSNQLYRRPDIADQLHDALVGWEQSLLSVQ